MSDRDSLLAVGFVAGNDGALVAPATSRVKLVPIGQFYELRVTLADGNALVCIVSKSALKVTREGTTPPDIVDVDTLVTGTSRKGRPW
jgi:hypothetical protein